MVAALRGHCQCPFDAHLMIAPVDPFLDAFAAAGADIITVQAEAGPHLHRSVQRVRGLGKRCGVALNPGTPAAAVEPVIGVLDLVLVMTVDPGFGGQSFLDSQLAKIRRVRDLIDASGRDIDLEVDGGITFDTAPRAIEAGADVLVAGTAVFRGGADAYADNIRRLRG